MHQIKVFYDMNTVISMNIGCLPETPEEMLEMGEMIWKTLQDNGSQEFRQKWGDKRKMGTGDMIAFPDSPICLICSDYGFEFRQLIDIPFYLTFPPEIRKLGLSHMDEQTINN